MNITILWEILLERQNDATQTGNTRVHEQRIKQMARHQLGATEYMYA